MQIVLVAFPSIFTAIMIYFLHVLVFGKTHFSIFDIENMNTVRAGDLGQISTLTLDCGPMESCIILPLVLFF
jgi:hypothetical protein